MQLAETDFLQKQLIKAFFSKIRNGGLGVRYWDGEEERYGDRAPRAKLIFKQCPANLLSFNDPGSALGEAYVDNVIDYEGPLEDILSLLSVNNPFSAKGNGVAKALKTFCRIRDRSRGKKNIQRHYDLGNDFFALWLDKTMTYSCAYFKHPDDSLEQAQLQKIDHILKKLNLQPGERLLDIGSGWGWLIIRAAMIYHVKATGITLSEEQYRKTRERIIANGLADQVNVQLISYLDLDETKQQFDKICSVGMFEHVGKENLPKYLDKVNKLLRNDGLFLLHTITGTGEDSVGSAWMTDNIFPGGYVPSLRETVWQLPECGFNLLHAESLRMHYAMTLDLWQENFSKNAQIIREQFDNRFIRMWELYLKGCAAAFRTRQLDLFQLLLSKGLNNQLPLTCNYS